MFVDALVARVAALAISHEVPLWNRRAVGGTPWTGGRSSWLRQPSSLVINCRWFRTGTCLGVTSRQGSVNSRSRSTTNLAHRRYRVILSAWWSDYDHREPFITHKKTVNQIYFSGIVVVQSQTQNRLLLIAVSLSAFCWHVRLPITYSLSSVCRHWKFLWSRTMQ